MSSSDCLFVVCALLKQSVECINLFFDTKDDWFAEHSANACLVRQHGPCFRVTLHTHITSHTGITPFAHTSYSHFCAD